jgi:uncharacterized SAM-binding protein YcdF (DUF218 family)
LWRFGRYGIALTILAYLFGLGYFLQATRHARIDENTHTDAVIALTGGSGRIAAAVSLLQQGLADRLFISGVNREIDPPELARLNGQSAALFRCCVVVGHKATNTVENASESAGWILQNHYKSVRLVTSDYHLPRALLEFRMALPDVIIIPNPVTAKPSPGLPMRFVLEYSKYLVALCHFELFQLFAA